MPDEESRVRRATRFYLRKVNRAVSHYGLIEPGDRIAVAVSGGQDSLALLRLLRERPAFFPPPYELVAIHVFYRGLEAAVPPREVLEAHLRGEGVPYSLVEVDLTGEEVSCFRCSWLRRKALFGRAQELGCNKLALAHHLEDIVETTLLNLFQHGRLERPEPCSPLFGGRLVLIRPLVFLTAHELHRYARLCGLPVYESNCPHGRTSERARLRACLRELHKARAELYINVFRAVEKQAAGRSRAARDDRCARGAS